MAALDFFEDLEKKYGEAKSATQNAIVKTIGGGFAADQGGKTDAVEVEKVVQTPSDSGKMPPNALLQKAGLSIPVSNTHLIIGAVALIAGIVLIRKL